MSDQVPSPGAVVFSPWNWKAHGAPERAALALSRAGWRVLYCENPATFLRRRGSRYPLAENVTGYRPTIVGHRLVGFRGAHRWQMKRLARGVLEEARRCGIDRPVVIYPHGDWVVDLAQELRELGVFSVYLCMDYMPDAELDALARASGLTLVIPQTLYRRLVGRFGAKIKPFPQFGPDLGAPETKDADSPSLQMLRRIRRPRLAYFGDPAGRLDLPMTQEVFAAHTEWQLAVCGAAEGLQLPNVQDIGWMPPEVIPRAAESIDAGFLAYDCSRAHNLHCVPLKLFDYFAAGLPVVSTPLLNLEEYGGLVYVGSTAAELAAAIAEALAEPGDDRRREERRRMAKVHSMDEMSKKLSAVLVEGMESQAEGPGRPAPPRRTTRELPRQDDPWPTASARDKPEQKL